MTEAYCFGRFLLDPAERTLSADGVLVPLGSTKFRILQALVENAGNIVAKEDLISLVGGRAASDHVLHVHLSALRKILGYNCIVTQQGRGYRFVAAVRRANAPPQEQIKSRAGNLPSLWTSNTTEGPSRLIGRGEQLRIVCELLARGRLVTLNGPGGVGKTRLALQAADEASLHFGNGVWLVELTSLSDPDLVPDAIASALGIKVGINATALDALTRHLAKKSLLIVLDNCEHVIAGAARTSEALLAAAAGVKILATSREALSCSEEQIVDVPPLALPSEAVMAPDVIRRTAAVELFIERAMDADASFRIDDEELALAAGICRRVDGLPLAIEMVAGWAGPLGLKALDARLDGSLKSWLRAKNTAPSRHATLRATLDWSHGLLSAVEQAVICRLAVFASSFTMEAAEAVASGDLITSGQVFEHVASLIRKSMIAVVPGSRVQRYRLLETTRAFMLDKLEASSNGHTARLRHAHYVLHVLESAECEWETTSDAIWLERYGAVLDDLRAAFDWAMGEDADDAVALAGGAWLLLRELSFGAEARRRLTAAEARLRHSTPPELEARLRHGLGVMLLNTPAIKEAHGELQRAAILYGTLDDRPRLGGVLANLGFSSLMLGMNAEAEKEIQEALNLLEMAGCLRTLAEAYSIQLCIKIILGHFDAARAAGENAEHLCEMAGSERTALVVAANLVQLHMESGDIDGAIEAGRTVTMRLRDDRHSELFGFVLGVLSAALTARGDLNEALIAAREAAPLLRENGTLFWLFDHLALRAGLAGGTRDAALIAGYANAVHQKFGRPREPIGRKAIERLQLQLRDALPEGEINRLGDMGARLTEDQAVALALGT